MNAQDLLTHPRDYRHSDGWHWMDPKHGRYSFSEDNNYAALHNTLPQGEGARELYFGTYLTRLGAGDSYQGLRPYCISTVNKNTNSCLAYPLYHYMAGNGEIVITRMFLTCDKYGVRHDVTLKYDAHLPGGLLRDPDGNGYLRYVAAYTR
jgi:hypothetical protein